MPVRRGRQHAASPVAVGGRPVPAAGAERPGRGIEAMWLDVLQRMVARAAHELKGALNGVSVNLEVVRSRASAMGGGTGGGGADPDNERISRYAHAAATQLELVITMSDALLALARAPREAAVGSASSDEIPTLLRRLVALIAPALRLDERTLVVVEPLAGVDAAAAPAPLVRALLGSALLAATEQWGHVRCGTDAGANRVTIERHGAADVGEGKLDIEREMLDAAADAGIQVHIGESAITMTFPLGNGGRSTGLAS